MDSPEATALADLLPARVRRPTAEPAAARASSPNLLLCPSELSRTLATLRNSTAAAARANQNEAANRLRNLRRNEPFRMAFRGAWPLCGILPPSLHRDWLKFSAPVSSASWPSEGAVNRLLICLTHGAQCALLGTRGTGKTQLAAWICSQWPEQAAYFVAADLFALIKGWYDGPDTEWNKRQLYRVPLMVIDEVQESLGTEHDDKLLTQLIDKRYAERRPTLLISNMEPKSFAERVGTSVASRITEGGTVEVFTGPGFRGKGALR